MRVRHGTLFDGDGKTHTHKLVVKWSSGVTHAHTHKYTVTDGRAGCHMQPGLAKAAWQAQAGQASTKGGGEDQKQRTAQQQPAQKCCRPQSMDSDWANYTLG
mmetsp:Transcript_54984/g.117343  ORF Transcript_54984/g.117343 Transcript_54984/m.117343 type:complete len:102 (+) Transcript_54984:126-431(+)